MTRTQAYIDAILTQVFILYSNQGITLTVSSIYIWDTPDPYTNYSMYGRLFGFDDQLAAMEWEGDLAHLIGYLTEGLANLDTL